MHNVVSDCSVAVVCMYGARIEAQPCTDGYRYKEKDIAVTTPGAASGKCQLSNQNPEYSVYVYCGGPAKNSTYEYQKLPKKGDCSSAVETSVDAGALLHLPARPVVRRASGQTVLTFISTQRC
jgi:hypothetical protein